MAAVTWLGLIDDGLTIALPVPPLLTSSSDPSTAGDCRLDLRGRRRPLGDECSCNVYAAFACATATFSQCRSLRCRGCGSPGLERSPPGSEPTGVEREHLAKRLLQGCIASDVLRRSCRQRQRHECLRRSSKSPPTRRTAVMRRTGNLPQLHVQRMELRVQVP